MVYRLRHKSAVANGKGPKNIDNMPGTLTEKSVNLRVGIIKRKTIVVSKCHSLH